MSWWMLTRHSAGHIEMHTNVGSSCCTPETNVIRQSHPIFKHRISRAGGSVKNPPAMQEIWVGKIPWRRKWQPTPVLSPEKSHGQRNLVGYSPWDRKESGKTE